MGRYAFFNTGFEYKFAFGIQSSYDIETFRGRDISVYDDDGETKTPSIEWNSDEKEEVLEVLKEISEENCIELPKFEDIPKNIDGTYLVDEYIKWTDTMTSNFGEPYYRFLLGCLIYHQLLYTDILTVEYEY